MSVLIGSARGNEFGKANGGKPGDQTLKEVSTQNWYLHSKGWIVIRAKDPEVRKKIAKAMKRACSNDNIGYCQDHRFSLLTVCSIYDYDPGMVSKKVECDCSALVRVCCLYAGIKAQNFTTWNEVSVLRSTGAFDILTDDKYCKSSDYLKTGDILVTKTTGHTVVVLSDGSKVTSKNVESIPSLKGYKGHSLVDGLKQYGYKYSLTDRAVYWSMLGHTSKYKGSSDQNIRMLNELKSR